MWWKSQQFTNFFILCRTQWHFRNHILIFVKFSILSTFANRGAHSSVSAFSVGSIENLLCVGLALVILYKQHPAFITVAWVYCSPKTLVAQSKLWPMITIKHKNVFSWSFFKFGLSPMLIGKTSPDLTGLPERDILLWPLSSFMCFVDSTGVLGCFIWG